MKFSGSEKNALWIVHIYHNLCCTCNRENLFLAILMLDTVLVQDLQKVFHSTFLKPRKHMYLW